MRSRANYIGEKVPVAPKGPKIDPAQKPVKRVGVEPPVAGRKVSIPSKLVKRST